MQRGETKAYTVSYSMPWKIGSGGGGDKVFPNTWSPKHI